MWKNHTQQRSNCHGQNLDSLLNMMFLHTFKFQFTCYLHQCKQAWWWSADMAGLPVAQWDQRLAVYGLFRIVRAESGQPYRPANLDCICKTIYSTWVLTGWRNHLLETPTLWPVSDILLYRTWCSIWIYGTRTHSKKIPLLGFAEHQFDVTQLLGPYPDQSNVACWFLEQTLTTVAGANQALD